MDIWCQENENRGTGRVTHENGSEEGGRDAVGELVLAPVVRARHAELERRCKHPASASGASASGREVQYEYTRVKYEWHISVSLRIYIIHPEKKETK